MSSSFISILHILAIKKDPVLKKKAILIVCQNKSPLLLHLFNGREANAGVLNIEGMCPLRLPRNLRLYTPHFIVNIITEVWTSMTS